MAWKYNHIPIRMTPQHLQVPTIPCTYSRRKGCHLSLAEQWTTKRGPQCPVPHFWHHVSHVTTHIHTQMMENSLDAIHWKRAWQSWSKLTSPYLPTWTMVCPPWYCTILALVTAWPQSPCILCITNHRNMCHPTNTATVHNDEVFPDHSNHHGIHRSTSDTTWHDLWTCPVANPCCCLWPSNAILRLILCNTTTTIPIQTPALAETALWLTLQSLLHAHPPCYLVYAPLSYDCQQCICPAQWTKQIRLGDCQWCHATMARHRPGSRTTGQHVFGTCRSFQNLCSYCLPPVLPLLLPTIDASHPDCVLLQQLGSHHHAHEHANPDNNITLLNNLNLLQTLTQQSTTDLCFFLSLSLIRQTSYSPIGLFLLLLD